MLMTGGSTIDSTLTSIAKLTGRDWRNDVLDAVPTQVTTGRLRWWSWRSSELAAVDDLSWRQGRAGDHRGDDHQRHDGHGTGSDLPAVLVAASRVRKLSYGVLPGVAIGVTRATERLGT